MTQKSYAFNYLKIYLWQGVPIILNLLSMFIVIPRLADNPTIYGIYVVQDPQDPFKETDTKAC